MGFKNDAGQLLAFTAFDAPMNTWNMIGFTYNGTYISPVLNGSIVSQQSFTGTLTYDEPIDIGGVPNKSWFFNGYISQVLLYTQALSSSEIQWNYLYPENPIRNGLVLWLQADPNNIKDIDNDGVLEWIDLSGNNNHGKIYGATLTQLVKPAIRILPKARILNILR